MYFVLIVCCLTVLPSAFADQCPGITDWFEFCCEDESLGCFDKYHPFLHMPLPCCMEGDDVTFELFTRRNKDEAVMIRRNATIPSEFSNTGRSFFLIHGWLGAGVDKEFMTMKDELLNKEDCNVIVIRWKYKLFYPQSASDIRVIGKVTSLVMETLVEVGGASYGDMWCVGHSLGAHTCGYAGRSTPEKIGRIIGLDPAGPWFEFINDVSVGLNSEDAQTVEVLHTDSRGHGRLGTNRPIGDVDIYVNTLGVMQPGCWTRRRKRAMHLRMLGCSHFRAVELFLESIKHPDCFISRHKCTHIHDMPGSCKPCDDNDGVCAVIGYGAQNNTDQGIYFLQTTADAPYCMG